MYMEVRIIRYLLIKETIALKELEKVLFILQIYKMRTKLVKIIDKKYNVTCLNVCNAPGFRD